MLTARINGRRLGSIGAHGPITVEYGLHGSEAASWSMSPTLTHPELKGNALVEIYDGGFLIWCGTLVEPGGNGSYSARGIWHKAAGLYPLDYLDNLTTNIDAALYGAIVQRGELPGWTQPVSISAVDWAAEPTPDMKLTDLFDRFAAENALNWYVTPSRAIVFEVLPTTPSWSVPQAVAGRGLAPAEDEFFTHLAGTFLDSVSGVHKTATVGSAEAEQVFSRRMALVDLSDLGATDSIRAASVLTGMLLKSGARMGWAEGLELGHGQITTRGRRAAPLEQITSLQMVRLEGVVDQSRPYLLRTYVDIVLQGVKYTDGSRRITLTPLGYAPRTMGDVLSLATAES